MRCNFHMHTTFCDGAHSPEEMVLSAIEQGGRSIGFSAHSPSVIEGDYGFLPFDKADEYKAEIIRLKEKYSGDIEIFLGIEQDYFSPASTNGYDYVIGSVHYVKEGERFIPIDISFEELSRAASEVYSGDSYRLAERYFDTVMALPEVSGCDVIGHFDLVTKFNDSSRFVDETSPRYRELAIGALDSLIEKDLVIEINTGAVVKGYKKDPYPTDFIISRVIEKNGRLMLGSDAHCKEHIFACFDDTVERIKSLGANTLWIYEGAKLKQIKI